MAAPDAARRGGAARVASARRVVVDRLARLRRPEVQTDLLQVVKAVVATVGAWVVAAYLLDLEQPFLAPWTALLTVHATVYRTFWRGAQSVLATGLGIIVSFLAVLVLGYGVLSIAAAVLVGLLLARVGVLRDEGVTVATTALFVLTAGFASQELLLAQRFADTLVGVVVGLAVNLLVVPPLDGGITSQQLDDVQRRTGALLRQMAHDLALPASEEHSRAWIEETRRIDASLDRAQELLSFSRESQTWNPRRRRSRWAGDLARDDRLLARLEEGVAQTRAIARAVSDSVNAAHDWDPRFREPWLDLLAEVGDRMADSEAGMEGFKSRIDALIDDLSGEDLPGLLWPVYGTLLNALSTIVAVADDVASTRTDAGPAEAG